MIEQKNDSIKNYIEEQFEVKVFFYKEFTNMNNLCGSYNLFINENENDEKIIDLSERFLYWVIKEKYRNMIEAEKLNNEPEKYMQEMTKKIDKCIAEIEYILGR